MPQDGSRLENEVELVAKSKDSFEVKLVNPSASVLDKISWWFSKDVDFVDQKPATKKTDRDADISV